MRQSLLAPAPTASSQKRIKGKVVGTPLMHCDTNSKIGGCAGTLKLERRAGDKTEKLTIKVPLGAPIPA